MRFFNLPPGLADEVRGALPGAELRRRLDHVLVFNLPRSGADLDRFRSIMNRLQLDPGQFEVIASVVTAGDNGGIELPPFVLDLIRSTRCGASFSFVTVGNDEPGEQVDSSRPE